jgi:hypothetical protein
MDKEYVIYINSRILFGLKKDIVSFMARWMKLEDIILSEISQDKKDKQRVMSIV